MIAGLSNGKSAALSVVKTAALNSAKIVVPNVAPTGAKSAASKTVAKTGKFAEIHMTAVTIVAIATHEAITATGIGTTAIEIIATTGTTITTGIIAITGTSTGTIAATTMATTIGINTVGTISGTIRHVPIIGVDTVRSIITRGQRSDTYMIATMCRATILAAITATTRTRSLSEIMIIGASMTRHMAITGSTITIAAMQYSPQLRPEPLSVS